MKTNKSKRLVLGEGETLGHKHVLESKKEFAFCRTTDTISFMLSEMGVLTHDEHDRMVFPAGKFRRYHQVEFNPMSRRTERVFD